MELKFLRADQARNLLAEAEKRKITKFYRDAAAEVQQRILQLENQYGVTASLKLENYIQLERHIQGTYDALVSQIETSVTNTMRLTSKTIVDEYLNVLYGLGVPEGDYMINVPNSVVNAILTGTVYTTPDNLGYRAPNWGLSKAIWSDNKRTLSDIHTVIAKGVVQGKPTYEIAKDLERYVVPGATKTWDWGKVYPGTKKTIDYNAQRLARTLINHSYQQTYKEVGDKNPYINYYVWHSVFEHGRTCQICMDMDGMRFRKDSDTSGIYPYPEMPLDHPNGLCYFTYDAEISTLAEDAAAWVRGDGGEGDSRFDELLESLRR